MTDPVSNSTRPSDHFQPITLIGLYRQITDILSRAFQYLAQIFCYHQAPKTTPLDSHNVVSLPSQAQLPSFQQFLATPSAAIPASDFSPEEMEKSFADFWSQIDLPEPETFALDGQFSESPEDVISTGSPAGIADEVEAQDLAEEKEISENVNEQSLSQIQPQPTIREEEGSSAIPASDFSPEEMEKSFADFWSQIDLPEPETFALDGQFSESPEDVISTGSPAGIAEGSLTLSDDAVENPIKAILLYEEEIVNLLSRLKNSSLDVRIDGLVSYQVSTPQKGTLEIAKGTGCWILETKKLNGKETFVCSSKAEEDMTLPQLRALSVGIAERFNELQNTDRIETFLTHELLRTMYAAFPINFLESKIIEVPKQRSSSIKDPVFVKIFPTTPNASHAYGVFPRYPLSLQELTLEFYYFRAIYTYTSTPDLSIRLDSEGHLIELSFGNDLPHLETWQIREWLSQLLITTKAMQLNPTKTVVILHPLILRLSPQSVLDQLINIVGGKISLNSVKFLNDQFEEPPTADVGGPRRQFIAELTRHFLYGDFATQSLAMAYQLPQTRQGALPKDVEHACKCLAALITYCHELPDYWPVVMGRVLDDVFFEIIYQVLVQNLFSADFSDENHLLAVIKKILPALQSLLPPVKINDVIISPDWITDLLDYYETPDPTSPPQLFAHWGHFFHTLAGYLLEDEPFPEGINVYNALNQFLIDRFAPAIRTAQMVAGYLPHEVRWEIQEIGASEYSRRVQGDRFNREAIANRIQAEDVNLPWLAEKAQWIQEFIRDPAQNQEWVENFLRLVTGSPSLLATKKNILIAEGPAGQACVSHTCFSKLDVPPDHPRVGLPKEAEVDDRTAFFHHLNFSIEHGTTFTVL